VKIPKKLQILGKTVVIQQPWRISKQDHRGEFDYIKGIIKVKRRLPKEEKETIFLHELTHAVLDYLEYDELSKDEKFVERFSKGLHQALTTME